jgi:phage terminase large subunit GpA-like protein
VPVIVVMKAAQVGWTEILNNAVGFHIDQDPAPLLVIQPTLEMAEAWSKDRLAPMLRDTPVLRGKVKDPRSRDADNTLLHKVFAGGHITMVGANSPASLAMRPIRIVLADEVDRYPVSAGTEGDPLKLAAKRQITFWNRKTLLGSTPTLKGLSVIEREWARSDQRRFFVPCPECGHEQVLHWRQVRWDQDEGRHRPETAHYACEACGSLWSDAARFQAVSRGAWQATAPFSGVVGFHIPAFVSPWIKLADVVREFLEAKNRPELLQVFVNTVLGETFEVSGERVEAGALSHRAEAYDGKSLPDEIRTVTAGVDVQDNRLEVQLVGWGENEESWPFLYEVLHGDPAQTRVWGELDRILLDSFHTTSGRSLRVRAGCVDTGGHHAATVMAFCRARRARRIFPTKGASGARPIWPKRASRTRHDEPVFVIGVDTAKDALFGRLKIADPGPGYVHFPAADGFEEAYFDQLTAEEVVTRHREGRPYRVWVLPKGRRNEALDTFVLALAARMSLPRALERQVEFTVEAPLPPSEPPAPRAGPPASQPSTPREGQPESQRTPGQPARQPRILWLGQPRPWLARHNDPYL